MSAPPPPAEWPKEVGDLFAPVRVVGSGAFASVWMAKRKTTAPGEDEHVAIKIMSDDGYANREVAILSELSKNYPHPNIVRLHQTFKSEGGSPKDPSANVHCFVLSLARGPTLHYILQKQGALGLVVAQSIARQLIGAVAFLHGHAVIHRDIQPCNIIVSGSKMDDDLWWADELDVDGKVATYARQCNITLVDFGFARALSSADIKTDVGLKKMLDENDKPDVLEATEKEVYDDCFVNFALTDGPTGPSAGGGKKSRGRNRTRAEDLNTSASHNRVRDLSALGTRNYAAPEILRGIRNVKDALASSTHSLSGSRRMRAKKTLGACVSDYSMTVDAFSVGTTIRHMVTGVPPSDDVEEFIAAKNSVVKKLARSFTKRIGKSGKEKRAKKYRTGADLPDEVNHLIRILTHYDSRQRATVRSVTAHSWTKLADSAASQDNGMKEMMHGGPIVYLQCG
ncbi:hypothetical protein ACHAXT_005464 [Thalassiosira profunda]